MPINANVSGGQQITASVGETKIDVAVSGGVGPTGAGGPAATITVGTVTTGAPGSSASVVNAGTTSAAVLNFTIPAGSTGPQGERGERGEQGIQGIQGIQGVQGPAGPTGPAGTTTWAGITDKPSTFPPTSHQHVAADISDFTSAVIAAAPPTTNASLLTSGTISEQRIPNTIARTSDVSAAVAAVVGAAPESLNTLQELSAALANDASFSATVTNSLASKAPLANPTFTGTVSGITKAMVGLSNVPNVDATARANHTGTQAISTVSGLQTALDAKAPLASPEFSGEITAGSATFVGFVNCRSLTVATASGTFSVSTTGTVTAGTWQGNAIAVTYGGTGATTASAARTNLGLGTAATANTGDFAAASHTHAASAITSGTFSVSRLPTVLEQTVTGGNTSTSVSLSLASGSVQTWTLNGNCTFTMPTAAAGASLTLILTQSGTFTATFTGVLWAGGTAPTITATANKVDVLVFVSNGTNWFGTAAQNF